MVHVRPMGLCEAREIACWRYPDPYAMYSFTDSPETITHLLNGAYVAVFDDVLGLSGLYCYGISARIPTDDPGVYSRDALDIGLGLRPDLCGMGLGSRFLRIAMEYGQAQYQPAAYRLSVAAFNHRAITVYARAGFSTIRVVKNSGNRLQYLIMQTPPLLQRAYTSDSSLCRAP